MEPADASSLPGVLQALHLIEEHDTSGIFRAAADGGDTLRCALSAVTAHALA